MYSKRVIHKAYVDNNAYISVNDPYKVPPLNPFRAPVKGEKLKSFDIPRIPQNAENGHFSKVVYKAGGYSEANKYKGLSGDDRKGFGFGSKDAFKRDEFSNTIRTEQYRAQLIREQQIMAKQTGKSMKDLEAILRKRLEEAAEADKENQKPNQKSTSRGKGIDYNDRCAQYDIGRSRTTPFDPRAMHDSYYKFDNQAGKRYGMHRPVSTEVGDGAWDVPPSGPAFGGRSEVKNFFDKSHLNVGQAI